jgi:signal peptidase II
MERVPPQRYLLFALITVIGCTVDLVTKWWFFSIPRLRAGDIFWLWTGHIGIQLSSNEGALFGLGQGQVWLFAALSIAAAIAIPIWLFKFGAARQLSYTVALGCVMAGVLGNLFDRLGFHREVWPQGYPRAGQPMYAVRDWILWQVNDRWRWPNFNIADSLLVTGVAILVLFTIQQPKSAAAAPSTETPAPSTRR